jgi:hypothetical protein
VGIAPIQENTPQRLTLLRLWFLAAPALLSCVGFGWYEGRAMGLRKAGVCWVGVVGVMLMGVQYGGCGAGVQVGGGEGQSGLSGCEVQIRQ